jgi:hypothetical protein
MAVNISHDMTVGSGLNPRQRGTGLAGTREGVGSDSVCIVIVISHNDKVARKSHQLTPS